MSFGVSVKNFKYPNFVNEIFAEIEPDIKDEIVKNIILSNVEKKEDGGFEISELMQVKSNRVSHLPDVKAIIGSLYWFTKLYPHEFEGFTKYIKVTKKLLDKVGFIKEQNFWKRGNVEIKQIHNDFKCKINSDKYIDFKYFDQLQYIYLIKTGEELSL